MVPCCYFILCHFIKVFWIKGLGILYKLTAEASQHFRYSLVTIENYKRQTTHHITFPYHTISNFLTTQTFISKPFGTLSIQRFKPLLSRIVMLRLSQYVNLYDSERFHHFT